MLDDLNPLQLQALHQVFLTEGFGLLMDILDGTFKEVTKTAVNTDSTADGDIQAMNQIRGFYAAIDTIRITESEVSSRVNETQQSLFSQRDNYDHPWIAEGSNGKETFLGGL